MSNIVAGIVLFNPDTDVLMKNINNLKKQFETIILYDNTPGKSALPHLEGNIHYLSEGKNRGIAHALNCIMGKGDRLGADWVVVFDQDSEIPKNIRHEYEKYLSLPGAGILCSQVIDRRRKYMYLDDDEIPYKEVHKCITSASCTRIKVWKETGGYDDILFIDLVDNDFSKRVRYKGYKVYQINSVVLEQQYGVIEYLDTPLSKFFLKAGDVLHCKHIKKLTYKKHVNPMRIYYTNRNVLYLNKVHKKHGGIGYESYYCKSFPEFYILFNLASILRSDKKAETIKAVICGTRDGRKLAKTAVSI